MNKNNFVKIFLTLLIIGIIFFVGRFSSNKNDVNSFITFPKFLEYKTFDMRQKILSEYKKNNPEMLLVLVDEKSYDQLTKKFGEWPIPRQVYAQIINHMEKDSPKVIGLDFMFVNSLKSTFSDDQQLVNAIVNNKNVFTAINFDDDPRNKRTPKLPESLKVDITNFQLSEEMKNMMNIPNCRLILEDIVNGTSNIGHINMNRDADGIARRLPPVVLYQNDFYPHLALKISKYLAEQESNKDIKSFDFKNKKLWIGDYKIPLDYQNTAILNWYSDKEPNKIKEISFYDVYMDAIAPDSEYRNFPPGYFKDKIIYLATSAVSLYDLKSTPLYYNTPGVKMHTTFISNFLDQNFVERVDFRVDLLLTVLWIALMAYVLYKINDPYIAVAVTILSIFVYFIFSTLILHFFNLWIADILPLFGSIVALIIIYIIKYLKKSKDLEYTYKLATTDGLTELYNHRYFQEQLILNIETCKRYKAKFSLILIDIDFFKKFNDTYGHQAGDAVLRQVAQLLKKSVRTSDIVCRYGGEEMSIILSNTDNEDAIALANKICAKVASSDFKLNPTTTRNVTISLGVSTYPKDGLTPSELIEKADLGLYKAKENGRNQVGIIEDSTPNSD